MTTSRRRGISPLLIAAAALLLGVLAYGFTATATVTNGNNLAGGQGNVVGLNFSINTNSVTYNFDNGAPDNGGMVNEVSFAAVTAGEFSTNTQMFVRALSTTAYNACSNGGSGVAPVDGFNRSSDGKTLVANRCNFPAVAINNAGFGLDVIIVE